jgi:hypothetical protein
MILNQVEIQLSKIAQIAEYLGELPFFKNLGRIFDQQFGKETGKRNDVTLNQTGTESAEGKFDRIQQEIYRMTGDGRGTPEEETAKNTKGILDFLTGQNSSGGTSGSIMTDFLLGGASFGTRAFQYLGGI